MSNKPLGPREIEEAIFEAIYANRDLQIIAELWEVIPITLRRAIYDIAMFAS